MAVELICSSYKRAGRVTTHKIVDGIKLYVPESQAEEYQAVYPSIPVVTHPDRLIGIDAKRQWWHDQHPKADTFHLDDDIIGMYRIWRRVRGWKKSTVSPDLIPDLIEQAADTAREMGAYLFGFESHANPMTYDALRPFRFGGYITMGAYGMLKGSKVKLLYDTGTVRPLPIGDYWLCCLNAYYHRYAFIDGRFAFGFQKTYSGPGGAAFQREPIDGVDAEVLATRFLKRHFGDAIQEASLKGNAATSRVRNTGRRRIVLPYHI
jgi:hypothetical protein